MKKDIKPFLKWAGGKTKLINEIEMIFPYRHKDKFSYIEPFVGSGAIFFHVLNKYQNIDRIIINDINTELINLYKTIKNNVEDLILLLKEYEDIYFSFNDNIKLKEYYYEQRNLFNNVNDVLIKSALFIFLNKTCFNGLYRVNKNNNFNVPMGKYKNPNICDEKKLLLISKQLENVIILNVDYHETVQYADRNSIFYLDPPYKPISETSKFNNYTRFDFNDNEQVRLKYFCDEINDRKSKWILSNSNHIIFKELYKDYIITEVIMNRNINSKGNKRNKIKELLIRNYKY